MGSRRLAATRLRSLEASGSSDSGFLGPFNLETHFLLLFLRPNTSDPALMLGFLSTPLVRGWLGFPDTFYPAWQSQTRLAGCLLAH